MILTVLDLPLLTEDVVVPELSGPVVNVVILVVSCVEAVVLLAAGETAVADLPVPEVVS